MEEEQKAETLTKLNFGGARTPSLNFTAPELQILVVMNNKVRGEAL